MLIEPNTIIRVLHNCPLDNTYNHTIYFGDKNQQLSYFQGLTKYTFSHQSYQRVNKGKMRIEKRAEDLYDCNYLMFQNSSFGNRWFYAFITSVEYVNNITSEITFEIDVMQTWFFDYNLKECFVEREHSVTDNIGDNLVPENLELGEYVCSHVSRSGLLDRGWHYMVAATFDEGFNEDLTQTYGGVYSGLTYNWFSTAKSVNDFINEAVKKGKKDGIVCIVPVPAYYSDGGVWHNANVGMEVTKTKHYDYYTARNNKLYTYPYNFLYVTNLIGNSTVYPYEYFNGNCTFTFFGELSCNPTFYLAPRNYKGSGVGGVNQNLDEAICMNGLPQCSYNTDTFKAWLAQNASNLAVSTLSTGVSSAIVGATFGGGAGAVIGGAGALVTSIAEGVSQVYQPSIRPPQASGNTNTNVFVSSKQYDFYFINKHIRPEFAKIIDDYFDMFGYATNRVKVPNISSRPQWNFTKTKGCVVVGSLPSDDMKKICNIYDNGITFWKNGNNVGNYSLNNRA